MNLHHSLREIALTLDAYGGDETINKFTYALWKAGRHGFGAVNESDRKIFDFLEIRNRGQIAALVRSLTAEEGI